MPYDRESHPVLDKIANSIKDEAGYVALPTVMSASS